METFVTVIHVITAFLIIIAVLLQGGNQGGIGATFGGGNSTSAFGAGGSSNLLTKTTFITAAIFMVTSIGLTLLQSSGYDIGLSDQLETKVDQQLNEESKQDQLPKDSTSLSQDERSQAGKEPSAVEEAQENSDQDSKNTENIDQKDSKGVDSTINDQIHSNGDSSHSSQQSSQSSESTENKKNTE